MSEPSGEPRLPPQATMGLLDYLTAHALDEDYAYASERRAREPRSSRRRRGVGLLGALALVLFAGLVVVAGAQTSRGAEAAGADREQLGGQVAALRERVSSERRRIADLERDTAALQERQLGSDDSASRVGARVERAGLMTGAKAAVGPGVVVIVDDAPGSGSERTQVLDSDLQRLVNGFWAAGAEAVSINGQRLTNLSTIRFAGSAITVNARSLRPPYRLQVLGDPDTLPARFAETASGRAWLDLQQQVGLQLEIMTSQSLQLPAGPASLRFAEPVLDEVEQERRPAPPQDQTGEVPEDEPGGTP